MQFLNPILPLAATDHFWPWDKDLVAVVYLKNDAKLDKWERDRRKSSKRCITEQIIPGWLKLIPLITQADPVDDSERLCRRHLVIVLLKARELAYLSTSSHPPLAGTCPARGGGGWLPCVSGLPCMQAQKTLTQWDTGSWGGSRQYETCPPKLHVTSRTRTLTVSATGTRFLFVLFKST